MWNFLHSIFGDASTAGGYPESLIKAAIERAVDGTAPSLRAVSGYQRRLRPAVVHAIEHVVALVDGLAPPVSLAPDSYHDNSLLRDFFISGMEVRTLIEGDRQLADFLRGQSAALPGVTALLALEKRQKMILGAELSGEVVLRDVPQIAVSFEDGHLIDPSASEQQTRRQLKRRAYDHLLSLALKCIGLVKSEREELERHRLLLQSKLNLLQRGGWGFDASPAGERVDIAGLKGELAGIDRQLLELGGADHVLEVYLEVVIDVLSRAEEHLWYRTESLIVDRMGIKRSEASTEAPEVTLETIGNDLGRSLVVSLVSLPGEVIRSSRAERGEG
jgi:hypothetical protein